MRSQRWLEELDMRLADQFRFLVAADALKGVRRGTRICDGSRHENSAEHSWHLALFALVLQEWAATPVSIDRVVRMLVLHDLIEAECGDTPLYDQAAAVGQAAREREAADRIFGLLPDDQGDGLRALWEEFEAADSADARFAKALDRLQPVLLNHAVGGGTWTDYDWDAGRERQVMGGIADGAPALWQAVEAVLTDAVAQGWLKPAGSTKRGC